MPRSYSWKWKQVWELNEKKRVSGTAIEKRIGCMHGSEGEVGKIKWWNCGRVSKDLEWERRDGKSKYGAAKRNSKKYWVKKLNTVTAKPNNNVQRINQINSSHPTIKIQLWILNLHYHIQTPNHPTLTPHQVNHLNLKNPKQLTHLIQATHWKTLNRT